jgi:hypothetical protein
MKDYISVAIATASNFDSKFFIIVRLVWVGSGIATSITLKSWIGNFISYTYAWTIPNFCEFAVGNLRFILQLIILTNYRELTALKFGIPMTIFAPVSSSMRIIFLPSLPIN